VALSLLVHWPLPLHLGSVVERDIGDPLVQAWQVAWGGHALAHQPLDYFQANTFYPLRDSLAFSDALTGYAPSGLIGHGTTAAIARYNLLFLFAYSLAFFGAYLLARELGVRPGAAAAAGAAFAYAPWRLEQEGHLHVLSSGGIALSLVLLLRGYRRRAPGCVLAGWLVAAWQLSLGFTLGLQLAYLLLALALAVAVIWWRAGKPRLHVPRAVIAASAAGIAIFGLTGVLLAQPYQRVLDAHPEAHRTTDQLSGLSGPPEQFIAAPEHNLIWGELTTGVRDRLSSVPEQTLFPGLAILALALIGLLSPALSKRLRIGLGIGVLGCAILSLGFHTSGLGTLYPYRALYELAPGWSGIRVPGRMNTLTSLGLALLVAGGAQQLLAGLRGRRLAIALATTAVVAAICVEGSGVELAPRSGGLIAGAAHPVVPKPPADQGAAPAPTLHLPVTIPANRRYVLWSTDGFPKIVNGRGSFDPAYFQQITQRTRSFPDRRSIAALRSIGVRSVVWHGAAAPLPPPRLGVTVRRYPALSVYLL